MHQAIWAHYELFFGNVVLLQKISSILHKRDYDFYTLLRKLCNCYKNAIIKTL